MKELLEQILNSGQLSDTCILLLDGTWMWGKIQAVSDDLLWFRGSFNSKSERFWTTVVRIEFIQAIDFRSDVRQLTAIEKEHLGLPVEKIE